ncbi:MAG: ABC transporter ATP-binding protein, partial [Candidatus Heimdallarchaeota archaeon]
DIIPDKGKIYLEHKDITKMEIEKRNIGYCPQDQALFPHLNVYDNISFGLKSKKLSKDEINLKVNELSEMADIKDLLSKKTHEISGGQKQRVSIIRAIVVNPKIILLDEPFHNIDASLKEQLSLYIRKIRNMVDLTVIFVTHDIDEAKSMADKILVMNKGKILQYGTPKEILESPNSLEAALSMNLHNVFDKKEGSKFSNQKINSFIRINPKKIIIHKIERDCESQIRGTIIAIIPDINKEVKSFIVRINGNVIIQIHKKLGENGFIVNQRVFLEFPNDAIQNY